MRTPFQCGFPAPDRDPRLCRATLFSFLLLLFLTAFPTRTPANVIRLRFLCLLSPIASEKLELDPFPSRVVCRHLQSSTSSTRLATPRPHFDPGSLLDDLSVAGSEAGVTIIPALQHGQQLTT